jgi:V/A-type H+-transporting ATPase subunit D
MIDKHVPLSKSELTRQKDSLASYRRYLPALDLKRQQLMAERNKARVEVRQHEEAVAAAIEAAGAALPMLADDRIGLDGLARLKSARLGTQNVAGVTLPVLEDVEIEVAPYGLLTRPHWVDAVVAELKAAIRLRVEAEIARRRIAILDKAMTRVTQRTNLFEKILIPETERNIRRILVYLGDAERAGVVAAKLSKRKRAQEAA